MQSIPIRSKKAAVLLREALPGHCHGNGRRAGRPLCCRTPDRPPGPQLLFAAEPAWLPAGSLLAGQAMAKPKAPWGLPRLKSIQCLGYFGQICPAGVSCRHQHQHVFIRKFRLYPSGAQSVSQCQAGGACRCPRRSPASAVHRAAAAAPWPSNRRFKLAISSAQTAKRAGRSPAKAALQASSDANTRHDGLEEPKTDSACLASCSKGHAAPLATWR